MNCPSISKLLIVVGLLISISFFEKAGAAIVTITVTGTVNFADGTYGDLTTSDTFSGIFKYNTDEAVATGADTDGSTDPGHEYSSFYDFSAPTYGATVTHDQGTPGDNTFNSLTAGLVVNDDMTNGGSALNNIIPSGTYDWIEILGSTASDGPSGYPADGQEWTLALFSSDLSWITDGSLIPDDLASSYTAIMVGAEFDTDESELGVVLVTIDTINIQGIPEPSAMLLIGMGIVGLVFARSRRIALD